jgi:hypothetical protein
MHDDEIRHRIVDKLDSGELPLRAPRRTWAGLGTGETCEICDESIRADAVEIEAEGADGKLRFYHSHCFTLLTHERNRRPG